jgi:tripartite-type tricarboxylate transporter receptor subunit TctC
MVKAIENPAVVERLFKQGIEPLYASTAEFEKVLRTDLEKTAKLIKAAGSSLGQ